MKTFLFIIAFLLCWQVQAANRENLNQLRAKISSLQKELEQKEESKVEAADALRASEKSISESNRKLKELSLEQNTVNANIRDLQGQTLHLQENVKMQQGLLGDLLYQRYLEGEQEYLKLLLGAHDPNQAGRNLRYYDYISQSRAESLRKLKANLKEIDSLVTQTKEKSRKLAEIVEKQVRQKETLEQEKKSRQNILNKVSLQISQQRKEISKLRRDENRLSKLVERIGKIIKHSSSSLSNNALPDSSFDKSPIQQLKGKLRLPIKGIITNRFGTPRQESGVLWKGLFIKAASGQEVKAVTEGRVVFADWLRGFGNMIILDHGNGFMSLYGNNETIFKQVGEEVHGGDAIATVGNSGGNDESGLYFELREQGTPLDPLKWVSIK